ncbi:helix-turn-helix domain-containing protein [Pediococcus acidilactici]
MKPADGLIFFDRQQSRRPKVILNLLKNKLTVSSLYGGLEYGLLNYIGFWKKLDRQEFLNSVDQAVKMGYLTREEDALKLTDQGAQQQTNLPMPPAGSLRIKLDSAISLWLMATQVASEYSFQNSRYVPVNEDRHISFMIKKWFAAWKQGGQSRLQLVQEYQQALTKLCEVLPQDEADWFVNYLPNHGDLGLTVEQLARISEVSPFQMELRLRLIFRKIFAQVLYDRVAPFDQLIEMVAQPSVLPESTWQTLQLLRKGYDVAKIAELRRVKPNTIKEHLLMMAILLDDFPYQQFLNPTVAQMDLEEIDFQTALQKYPALTFFDFRLSQIRYIKERQGQ